MNQISPNAYAETDVPLCNLGLVVTREGNVLIDTPMYATSAVRWRDEVSKKGVIRYLVNTEEHPDHYRGTWFFSGLLVSHQETRDKLAKVPQANYIKSMQVDPDGKQDLTGLKLRLADISFTGNLELHLGDHTIKLFPLPGHCSGCIGVFVPEEQVVYTGDCVFSHAKTWLQESDPEAWLASLKKLEGLDVENIIPGHGPVCKKDYLKEQAAIVKGWIEVVKNAIKQGWSVDEAIARVKSPDPYPKQPGVSFSEDDLNRMNVTRLYQLYSK